MEYQTITYKEMQENPEVTALMERGNDMLGEKTRLLGYPPSYWMSKSTPARLPGGREISSRRSDTISACANWRASRDICTISATVSTGSTMRTAARCSRSRSCAGLACRPGRWQAWYRPSASTTKRPARRSIRCRRRSFWRTRATCAATACATGSRRRLTSTTASITPPWPPN